MKQFKSKVEFFMYIVHLQNKMTMNSLTKILLCYTALLSILTASTAINTIAVNQTIRDGDTIVSADETFKLGFFSPGRSVNRYVGIWYNKITEFTVVWVANREVPLANRSGVLTLDPSGTLVIRNTTAAIIWSSNSSRPATNPVARLLDSGNLVIGDSNPENFIWQSFDYPTDTQLPGMKIGKDLVTGIERRLRSWKSVDDPSIGGFSIEVDTEGYPQGIQWQGEAIQFRVGPWDGLKWSGMPALKENPIFTFEFVLNQSDIYYKYELRNSSVVSRMTLTADGNFNRMNWINRAQGWHFYSSTVADNCARYRLCGAYGSCNINNTPLCECIDGFEPRKQEEWSMADWSSGCRRRNPLNCHSGDGFRKYSNLKLPDSRGSWFNQTMNLQECKTVCLNNCSCTAYSNSDIRGGGRGCIIWFGELIDIREFDQDGNGDDLYIRMASSDIDVNVGTNHNVTSDDGNSGVTKRRLIIVIIPVLFAITTILVLWMYLTYKRKSSKEGHTGQEYENENHNEELELPWFNLSTFLEATNNFSVNSKLGEGGFGPVYKGRLITGQEIAVKRLSKNSGQGLEEFKNEIRLISKLQHRNLVRILGYCLEGDERMLAYEYLPNRSLDYLIFDKDRKSLLPWKNRCEIILGIAKGLSYLHHDSRLLIIHRDLKASNILLDSDLNPKISDFGIARIFGGDQGEGKTKHVIGTYGYMSPEYAIHGNFSVKSDVFSFGVLLLEILSGTKVTKYQNPDHHHSLLGHAWLLWYEGKALELADSILEDSLVESQMLKFIQVALLCTQKFPKDRPTMSSVVLMLCNDGVTLPPPKQPGFFLEGGFMETDMSSGEESYFSRNSVTITALEGR
ncbi:hypothetical protein L6452_28666 [Arctium lappa]|uniref:Uncharacterized protein n=1 Tax=Arctium lappa TaxID=4217 RepID=A0ACB8ZZ46_ARCLA|nr:hypothetical protein L6452_28666 [Arctium lappa]